MFAWIQEREEDGKKLWKLFFTVFIFNLIWGLFVAVSIDNFFEPALPEQPHFLLKAFEENLFDTTFLVLKMAFIEELIFRVFPITVVNILIRFFSIQQPGQLFVLGAIISSALFGLVHGETYNILTQGVAGLGYSLIYLKNGGSQGRFLIPIAVTVLLHMLHNITVLGLVFLDV